MTGERRLAAVLALDVAGFTAAVNADERGAVRAVRAHLEAMAQLTGLNGGRVVKTLGDGLLAEFSSAVAAVEAAAAMQSRMAERNRDLPEAARFQLRIGVHAGEVIVEGDDIFGEDVNLAARLEAEAPPGGVLISARTAEAVEGRTSLSFQDAGERRLKGFARPVAARTLAVGPAPAPRPAAPALPDKPSVAVLPFVNMSSDPEQEFFADGLTEDLITALASVPWLFVIARNSSFLYKGAPVDVRQVGRDLGVAYVLEGSVRRAGGRLRVTGQLVDAETGAHLWADRMDGALEDVFDLQDRVTEAVVGAIAPGIRGAETARAAGKRPESLSAYDLHLQALAAISRVDLNAAERLLDRAIDAAPDYARALALRAWVCTLIGTWTDHGRTGLNRETALRFAEAALEADPEDSETMAFAGYALAFFDASPGRGLSLLREAARRCPSFAWAWSSISMIEALRGDPERALEPAERAMRLSPRDPFLFRTRFAVACAWRAMGRMEDMLEEARAAAALNANVASLYSMEVQALMELGREDEARRVARAMADRFPDFRFRTYVERAFRVADRYSDSVRESVLRTHAAAGLPE